MFYFLGYDDDKSTYCNRLPYLPDFGYNNYVARPKHGSVSRNIQAELEAALFFQILFIAQIQQLTELVARSSSRFYK
jgi:hypothetical protein